MKIDVVLYNTQAEQKDDLSNLCPRDIQAPIGFTINGGSRKFIVLMNNARNHVVVAIGEPLQDKYYYHKDILKHAGREFSECSIYGGGQVDFELNHYRPRWSAKFSGSSGDFGVFDKVLLENEVVNAIAKAMQMNVRVEMTLSATASF